MCTFSIQLMIIIAQSYYSNYVISLNGCVYNSIAQIVIRKFCAVSFLPSSYAYLFLAMLLLLLLLFPHLDLIISWLFLWSCWCRFPRWKIFYSQCRRVIMTKNKFNTVKFVIKTTCNSSNSSISSEKFTFYFVVKK